MITVQVATDRYHIQMYNRGLRDQARLIVQPLGGASDTTIKIGTRFILEVDWSMQLFTNEDVRPILDLKPLSVHASKDSLSLQTYDGNCYEIGCGEGCFRVRNVTINRRTQVLGADLQIREGKRLHIDLRKAGGIIISD